MKNSSVVTDTKDIFPGIFAAAVEIAYDNGMINRYQSEQAFFAKVCRLIESKATHEIIAYDKFLQLLSKDEMETLCAGEDLDQQKVLRAAPAGTNDFLTEVFEL